MHEYKEIHGLYEETSQLMRMGGNYHNYKISITRVPNRIKKNNLGRLSDLDRKLGAQTDADRWQHQSLYLPRAAGTAPLQASQCSQIQRSVR